MFSQSLLRIQVLENPKSPRIVYSIDSLSIRDSQRRHRVYWENTSKRQATQKKRKTIFHQRFFRLFKLHLLNAWCHNRLTLSLLNSTTSKSYFLHLSVPVIQENQTKVATPFCCPRRPETGCPRVPWPSRLLDYSPNFGLLVSKQTRPLATVILLSLPLLNLFKIEIKRVAPSSSSTESSASSTTTAQSWKLVFFPIFSN